MVLLAGEMTTSAWVDLAGVARRTIREIGYDRPEYGFDSESCAVLSAIDPQSADIALGVDTGGAGDQGLMFGFACRETPELMPLPIVLAHGLTRRLRDARRAGDLPWLRPDGKSQVTVEYRGTAPVRVHTVVVSTQHDASVDLAEIRRGVIERIVRPVIPAPLLDEGTIFHVNPTGRFVIGGPQGDCGLTGRKIIVDTYGGVGSHGGGAFSGKDPTKVDRSASYMARHVAKNLVAAGVADRIEVQIAYAIGVPEPVSVHVDTFGTGELPHAVVEDLIRDQFPLTPRGIIDYLDLRRPIFRQTAAFGHFGRDEPDLTWERTHRAADLRGAARLGGAPPAAVAG
jgi:S-adenosylmethionine synthetase